MSSKPSDLTSKRNQDQLRHDQLLADLSKSIDVQHHDVPARHSFGTTFNPPVATSPTVPGTAGTPGQSDDVARADHTHGFSTGPWQVTTCGLISTGTLPTPGAGALDKCKYVQLDKFVYCQYAFSFGTGMTPGTGAYVLSMPVPAKNDAERFECLLIQGTNYLICVGFIDGSNHIQMRYPTTWPTGPQATVAATVPWAWAAAGSITCWGAYEAA